MEPKSNIIIKFNLHNTNKIVFLKELYPKPKGSRRQPRSADSSGRSEATVSGQAVSRQTGDDSQGTKAAKQAAIKNGKQRGWWKSKVKDPKRQESEYNIH